MNRQRYHIIGRDHTYMAPLVEALRDDPLTDTKQWVNFPLLVNVSLTAEQAQWFRSHPMVLHVEPVAGIYLHEDKQSLYEVITTGADIPALRREILRHMDVEVKTFVASPNSVWLRLLPAEYTVFMGLLALGGEFLQIQDVQQRLTPHGDHTRVLDLDAFNWGLERITHRSTRLYEQVRLARTGKGVRVYVVDTGVQRNHDELRSHVNQNWRYDAFRSITDVNYGNPSTEIRFEDGNIVMDDHGTHVASIIAGSTVGVAVEAEIISVRAFSNFEESTAEHLIGAIDWIITTAAHLGGPSLVNMSLSIDDASVGGIRIGDMLCGALISAGITPVVSAGNDGADAFFSSPGNAGTRREIQTVLGVPALNTEYDYTVKPITVGATIRAQSSLSGKDEVWPLSNWGDVLDIWAPGANIYAASLSPVNTQVDLNRTGSYDVKSGTSMAAPHVTGILALHLEDEPTLTPTDLRLRLQANATRYALDNESLTHERQDDVDALLIAAGLPVGEELQNPEVMSPNSLAWVGYVSTETSFIEESHAFSVPEHGRVEFTQTARALDYYGDSERVTYSYEALDIPVEFMANNIVFYTQTDYEHGLPFNERYMDRASFRLDAASITADSLTGTYVVFAGDTRSTSARRFTVTITNVPEAPTLALPVNELLLSTPAHKGDLFDENTLIFRATHPDNLTIQYTMHPADALPEGLQFINDPIGNRAYLRGRIARIPQSTDLVNYRFIVRATAENSLIDERLFVLPAEYLNESHYFLPSWFSSLYDYNVAYPGVKFFSFANAGNSYYKRFEVVNTDADPLTYSVEFVPSIVTGPGIYNGSLPTGLAINGGGETHGIIDPSSPLGLYFFRLVVSDPAGNEIFQDFVIELKESDDDVLTDSDQIIWITPSGPLGQIYETFASHLGVEASNPEGSPVKYSLSPNGGNLPQGMEVDTNTGLIVGVAPFVAQDVDYYFTVRATVGTRYVDRNFSLRILSQYAGVSVMNFKASVFGPDRMEIQDWTTASTVLTRDNIFRPTDPNFGTPAYPHMYVLSGTSVVQPSQIMDYLKDYHKRMHLLFGELKYAEVKDPSGYHAYDVIYMSVTDPLDKAGGFTSDLIEEVLVEQQENPYDIGNWNPDTKAQRYFPNSIANARDDLISTVSPHVGLGVDTQEGLPLWMRQGFRAGIVIAYVKPGTGLKLTNNLVAKGYNKNFVGRNFILDRYYISTIATEVTTLFDVVNGEATTFFDDPITPNVQGDDTTMYGQQTLFDVMTTETGKYYKFEDDAPILADRAANLYG